MKNIILSILGSTGSIGSQTLDVLRLYYPEIAIDFLTTNTNIVELERQLQIVKPYGVAIVDETSYKEFKRTTSFAGKILCGYDGLIEASSSTNATHVMSSLVGFSGVLPTINAIKAGATICLANKETLVSAGEYIMSLARTLSVPIIAVDSEHSAILQSCIGEDTASIEKLIITASGGPFRDYTAEQLLLVTPEQALRHPNWTMGSKITIDSSTLMNKGLEVIEARWLFDIKPNNIEVVVHPQSIIHSMVQFIDGSVKAQLGLPDMKLPIHYALSYPKRRHSSFQRMTITDYSKLTFDIPDTSRFPCLSLAYQALDVGGTATAILNAANEVAVEAFLNRKISYMSIPHIIESTLSTMTVHSNPSLEQILESDALARTTALSRISRT